MLIQPIVSVEEKELFTPKHAGKCLAHNIGLIFTYRWRCYGLVKFIGFTKAVFKYLFEIFSKRTGFAFYRCFAKTHTNHRRLTGANSHMIMCSCFGSRLFWIYY